MHIEHVGAMKLQTWFGFSFCLFSTYSFEVQSEKGVVSPKASLLNWKSHVDLQKTMIMGCQRSKKKKKA